MRTQVGAGRGGPRKPSAAVAQAMAKFKAAPPVATRPSPAARSDAAPFDVARADAEPPPNPDIVFTGPRAMVVKPSILAWVANPNNWFHVAAPVFKFASGPHITVRDDNSSVLVEWKWHPLYTTWKSPLIGQFSFDVLSSWGAAAESTHTPATIQSCVVPVPGGLKIKERLNIVHRDKDTEFVVAGYTTNLSPPAQQDQVEPPQYTLVDKVKPTSPVMKHEVVMESSENKEEEEPIPVRLVRKPRAKFMPDEPSKN